MAMRVPNTMRAWPLCAANQLWSRWGAVMPLCIDTTPVVPKRALTRSSSWGVRLISGTIKSAWALGSSIRQRAMACKYTSVLPLPVAPNKRNGPVESATFAKALFCCSDRGHGDCNAAVQAFSTWASCFFKRRFNCELVRSRN